MPDLTSKQLAILVVTFVVAIVALTFVFNSFMDSAAIAIPVAGIIAGSITYAAWIGVRSMK